MNVRLIAILAFNFSVVCVFGQDSITKKKEAIVEKYNMSREQFKRIFLSSPVIQRPRNYIDSFSQLTKSIVAPLKNPVIANNASVIYEWTHDTSYVGKNSAYSFGNFNASADLLLAGIPAGINFQNQTWSDAERNDLSNFSFRFDKDQYIDALKKKLSSKFDPSSLLKTGVNPFEDIIKNAKQSLQSDITNLNNSYGGILNDDLKQIGDLQSLFKMDINKLKEKLLTSDMIKGLKEKENLVNSLQQKINNGEKISMNEMNELQREIKKVNAVNELIEKIASHKAKWEQSGLLKKLKNFDLLQKNKISQLINDPSMIRQLAKQHLSLKGLQKFFLNTNQLDIGKSALSLSPMSFQHFLNNGVVAEFVKNNGKTLTLLAGKQKDFNSILDYAFNNNLNSNNAIAKAISLGVGSGSNTTTHISVLSFSQSPLSVLTPADLNNFRQVLVTTISNQLNIGENRSIAVDLSRSATQYRGSDKGNNSIISGNNIQEIISAKGLMSNTAISLKYADEYIGSGLSYQASFNKVTDGYNNPGNLFLSGGSTEAGLAVRKSFLKNKMVIAFRGNTRWYKYSDKIDMKWRNEYYVFDLRWRLKKGQYVGLRYQPVRMIRIQDRSKRLVTAVERLAVEANLSKQINKISYHNYLSVTRQKNIYATSGMLHEKNVSLLISSFQNILVSRKIFYINTNYNYTNNSTSFLYFNSSLFLEAGYSYRLTKDITASTGYIYNSIKGWYQQTGIRQTISGQLGERLSVDLYLDAKKNLKVYQSLWDDPLRTDINLRYNLHHTSSRHEIKTL